MSYDLSVEFRKENMPTPEEWRDAIIKAGFPAELYVDFEPQTFSGFLPCPYEGEISGFEYYWIPEDEHEASVADDKSYFDTSILFSIGSRPLELRSALAASSILAEMTDGKLVDNQTGDVISGPAAVQWARSLLSQISP